MPHHLTIDGEKRRLMISIARADRFAPLMGPAVGDLSRMNTQRMSVGGPRVTQLTGRITFQGRVTSHAWRIAVARLWRRKARSFSGAPRTYPVWVSNALHL